ncbi:MAG TPA: hypothetical protein VGL38_08855 [bacterium]|jgi:bifunctional DNA-binding transcriptional regulator/antitoxin component of YhaV-PrlF toxin-antitoxin module
MENRPRSREPKTSTARIRAKNQITLPQAVCEAAKVSEGAFVAFTVARKRTVVPPGSIILSPQLFSDRPWTAEDWEKAEQEAYEDIKAGRVSRRYKGAKAAIAALKSKK